MLQRKSVALGGKVVGCFGWEGRGKLKVTTSILVEMIKNIPKLIVMMAA